MPCSPQRDMQHFETLFGLHGAEEKRKRSLAGNQLTLPWVLLVSIFVGRPESVLAAILPEMIPGMRLWALNAAPLQRKHLNGIFTQCIRRSLETKRLLRSMRSAQSPWQPLGCSSVPNTSTRKLSPIYAESRCRNQSTKVECKDFSVVVIYALLLEKFGSPAKVHLFRVPQDLSVSLCCNSCTLGSQWVLIQFGEIEK
jgi:hypothetical protein